MKRYADLCGIIISWRSAQKGKAMQFKDRIKAIANKVMKTERDSEGTPVAGGGVKNYGRVEISETIVGT